MLRITTSIYLALLCVVGLVQSQSQRLTLYEGRDSTGAFLNFGAEYVPDLTAYNFNNRARSVCLTGVWLFYDLTQHNGGINAPMEYVYGNNYCTNLQALGGAVTSLRYAGVPNDYRLPSITLYSGTYFQGAEEYTTASLPNLSLIGRITSILVTGAPSDGWTLYDRPNYVGNAICVYPPPGTNYEPGFVPDTTAIGIPHGTIQSVRRGCFGKKILQTKSKFVSQAAAGAGQQSQQGYYKP